MAIANLNNIDDKLVKMYEAQVTTNTTSNTEDRSQLLFDEMKIIALNNKMFLNLK